MPVQALALVSLLMAAQPPGTGAPLIGKVAAPCHIVVDGECKVQRKPETPTAGNGGDGGNATVNYNFYLGGATAGNGGNGGNVGAPPGAPSKASPATPGPPPDARRNAAAPDAGLEGAVSYFTWTYNFEPEPGQRVWSRNGSRWSEKYPSEKVAKVYNTVVPGSVQGCPGQLVSHTADPSFEVFIPHKGCARMFALFRRDMGAWNGLGQMRDVR